MYKASVGLLGVGVLALAGGWLGNVQPLIYASIGVFALAFLFLIVSMFQDRGARKRLAADGPEAAPGWAAPEPPVRAEPRRAPRREPRPEPLPEPRSEPPATAFRRPAQEPSGWRDDPSSTMAMPFPVPEEDPTDLVNRRRFGRKSRPEPLPDLPVPPVTRIPAGDDSVEQLQTFGQSASAELRSFDPEAEETPEERLARATEEAEALLSLPIPVTDDDEAPPPSRPVATGPTSFRPTERPAPPAPKRDPDAWLDAAMRRRQARAASEAARAAAAKAEQAALGIPDDATVSIPVPSASPVEPEPVAPEAGEDDEAPVPWSVRRKRAMAQRAQRAAAGAIEEEVQVIPVPPPISRVRALRPPADEDEEPYVFEPAIAPWQEQRRPRPPAQSSGRRASSFEASSPEAEPAAPSPVAAKARAKGPAKPAPRAVARPMAKPGTAPVAPARGSAKAPAKVTSRATTKAETTTAKAPATKAPARTAKAAAAPAPTAAKRPAAAPRAPKAAAAPAAPPAAPAPAPSAPPPESLRRRPTSSF